MSLPAVKPSKTNTAAGFTLVEVLVAVALLGMIGAMVFGSLVMTTSAVEAGRDSMPQRNKRSEEFYVSWPMKSPSANAQTVPVGRNERDTGRITGRPLGHPRDESRR